MNTRRLPELIPIDPEAIPYDNDIFRRLCASPKENGGEYIVSKKEVLEFAGKWDPQPYHIDETKAKASIHGGVIASATHTLAISFLLRHQIESDVADVAGLELDEMQFQHPVRPGDRLSITIEYVARRESRNRYQGDRGQESKG